MESRTWFLLGFRHQTVFDAVFDAVALDCQDVTVIVDATAARTPEIHAGVVRENDPLGRDVECFRRPYYEYGNGPVTKGTEGAELVDGLVEEEGDYKLVKMRISAFFNTHLDSYLQSNGIKSLVVVGIQTPNCIRQTVFDAVALDYQDVTVIVDATAVKTPEVHAANIFDMKNINVKTPTLEEWCSEIH